MTFYASGPPASQTGFYAKPQATDQQNNQSAPLDLNRQQNYAGQPYFQGQQDLNRQPDVLSSILQILRRKFQFATVEQVPQALERYLENASHNALRAAELEKQLQEAQLAEGAVRSTMQAFQNKHQSLAQDFAQLGNLLNSFKMAFQQFDSVTAAIEAADSEVHRLLQAFAEQQKAQAKRNADQELALKRVQFLEAQVQQVSVQKAQYEQASQSVRDVLEQNAGFVKLPTEVSLLELITGAVDLIKQQELQIHEVQKQNTDLASQNAVFAFQKREFEAFKKQFDEFMSFMDKFTGANDLSVVQAQFVAQAQQVDQLQAKMCEQNATISQTQQDNVFVSTQLRELTDKLGQLEQKIENDNIIQQKDALLIREQQGKLFEMVRQRDALFQESQQLKHANEELEQQLSLSNVRCDTSAQQLQQLQAELSEQKSLVLETREEAAQLASQMQLCKQQFNSVQQQNQRLLASQRELVDTLNSGSFDRFYDAKDGMKEIGISLLEQFQQYPQLIRELQIENIALRRKCEEHNKQIFDERRNFESTAANLDIVYQMFGERLSQCSFAKMKQMIEALQKSDSAAQEQIQLLNSEAVRAQIQQQHDQLEIERLRLENEEKQAKLQQVTDQNVSILESNRELSDKTQELGFLLAKLREKEQNMQASLKKAESDATQLKQQLQLEMEKAADLLTLQQSYILETDGLQKERGVSQQQLRSLTAQLESCRERMKALNDERTHFITFANERFGLTSIFGVEDPLDNIAKALETVLRERPSEYPNLQKNYASLQAENSNTVAELKRVQLQAELAHQALESIAANVGAQFALDDYNMMVTRVAQLQDSEAGLRAEQTSLCANVCALEKQLQEASASLEVALKQKQQQEQQLSQLSQQLQFNEKTILTLQKDREHDHQALQQYVEEIQCQKTQMECLQVEQLENTNQLEAFRSQEALRSQKLDEQDTLLQTSREKLDSTADLLQSAISQLKDARCQLKTYKEEKIRFVIQANEQFGLGCIFGPEDPLDELAAVLSKELQRKPEQMTNLQQNYANQLQVNRELTDRMQKMQRCLQEYDEFFEQVQRQLLLEEDENRYSTAIERLKAMKYALEEKSAQVKLLQQTNAQLDKQLTEEKAFRESAESKLTQSEEKLTQSEKELSRLRSETRTLRQEKDADQSLLQQYRERLECIVVNEDANRLSQQQAERCERQLLETQQQLENAVQKAASSTAAASEHAKYMVKLNDFIAHASQFSPKPLHPDTVLEQILEILNNIKQQAASQNAQVQHEIADGADLQLSAQPKIFSACTRQMTQRNSAEQNDLLLSQNQMVTCAPLCALKGQIPDVKKCIAGLRDMVGLAGSSAIFYPIQQAISVLIGIVNARQNSQTGFQSEATTLKKQLFEQQKIVMSQLQQMGIFYSGGDTVQLIYFLLGQIAGRRGNYVAVPEIITEVRRLESQNKELMSIVQLLEIKLRQAQQFKAAV